MKGALAFLCLLGSAAAFAPAALRPAVMQRSVAAAPAAAGAVMVDRSEAADTWWGDKDYPPSIVLGIGKDVPSSIFGSTVNGFYVAGALLVPYSWGLHVAAWIQKQNG